MAFLLDKNILVRLANADAAAAGSTFVSTTAATADADLTDVVNALLHLRRQTDSAG